uniref:Tubulin-specific chaperone A n=1 Tax=Meloidogyne floridensis TaxID=298350 RepID=A0A915P7S3_9BILA
MMIDGRPPHPQRLAMMSDRVLRSHTTKAMKEKKLSDEADKLVKDLQKSVVRNRLSSTDLAVKRKEFQDGIKREKEKTAEAKKLRDVPLKYNGPMEAGSDDLISKLKGRHKEMTETIDNEIAFVLNLCKELDINVDDIMKEDDP